MKSEAFYEALRVRAAYTDQHEEPPTSPRVRIFSSIILLIAIVAGGGGLFWKEGAAALLALQTDDDLFQQELDLLQASRKAVFGLRVSPQSDYFCFRSLEGELYRVNNSVMTDALTQQELFPNQYCIAFALSPVADQVLASFTGGAVVLKSFDLSCSSVVLRGETSDVLDILAYNPNGSVVAGASSSGGVFVWDVETGALVSSFHRADDEVASLVFDSQMGLLVSFESGLERWILDPNQESVSSYQLDWKVSDQSLAREMVVTSDGRFLVTVDFFGKISARDLERRELLWEQVGVSPSVRGLTIAPDSSSVFCYSTEQELIEYDLKNGSELSAFYDPGMGAGTGAGFSPEGDLIYSGSIDGFIRIWSVKGNFMISKIDTALL